MSSAMHKMLYIYNFLQNPLLFDFPPNKFPSVPLQTLRRITHSYNQINLTLTRVLERDRESAMSDDTTQPFAKTICSICHEHLKPIVENLQAISICGHVFHELCIQQWFEYCSKGKKKCPICKQTCSASNVSRLYFQSPSDSNDPNLSQILQPHKEDPDELKLEVRRLEGKINVLISALECRDNELENIRNELGVCKEQLKEEATAKKDAMTQTKTINYLLEQSDLKCKKSDMKCTKLQERNLSLAKELAALKLVSDLDLEEEGIVKFASLATEPQSQSNNSVNFLHKLLANRNKLYKELINKFKALSIKESKAKEQLEKLKKEMQKLETDKKVEDNEVLRAQKASKKTKYPPSLLNQVDPTLNDTCIPQDTIKERDINFGKRKRLREYENINDSVPQPTKSATTDASNLSKKVHETSEHNGVPWNNCKEASSPGNPQEGNNAVSGPSLRIQVPGPSTKNVPLTSSLDEINNVNYFL